MKKSSMCYVVVAALGISGQTQAQYYNTVTGENALNSVTTGSYNGAFGAWTLFNNTTGQNNTASGFEAMLNNQVGNYNSGYGMYSLFYNTSGLENTAVGYQSLFSNQNGNNNIAIGYQAGFIPTNGNNNIEIGHIGLTNDMGVIRIGTQGVQRFTQIAGIRGTIVKGGQAVVVSKTGQLGVASLNVVPNVMVATAADALSLQTQITQLRKELNALKTRVH